MIVPDVPIAVDQPTEEPVAARTVSRRTVLRFPGLDVGVVAVAGATGLTWRAVDGDVFASGTGPAYAAIVTPVLAILALVLGFGSDPQRRSPPTHRHHVNISGRHSGTFGPVPARETAKALTYQQKNEGKS